MANIIITGASNGIGFETALELVSRKSNNVIAIARSSERLSKLYEIASSLYPDGGTLHPVQFDLINDDISQSLVPFVASKFEHVDILINNAGDLIYKPFKETSMSEFAELIQVNYLAQVEMIKNFYPMMKEESHIVNIGSMGGVQGSVKFPGLAAYSASKGALAVLTECLAEEFKTEKIAVNCLALGSSQTEMFERAFPGVEASTLAFEMGKYIADFSQTAHKFFNGKVIPVANTTP